MSREIKFRWWRDGRMWPEFDGWCEGIGINEAINAATHDYGNPIMQFTGLKDKNGVEIYEGDILGFDNAEDNSRFEVVWQSGAWRSKYSGWPTDLPEYPLLKVLPEYTIVIGNIHENPELSK